MALIPPLPPLPSPLDLVSQVMALELQLKLVNARIDQLVVASKRKAARRGKANSNAPGVRGRPKKISDEAALEMIAAYMAGGSPTKLARKYNICAAHVSNISNGRTRPALLAQALALVDA